MVNKSCDTEVVVAYDVLVGVEYLSYLEGCLSLLEGACEVLNADYRSADADVHLCEELAGQRVGDGARQLFKVAHVDVVLYFLDENDVVFRYVEYEILVLVREEVLYNVVSGDVVGGDNADEEHDSADIGVEVQLARLEADIAGQDIVKDYILYEVVAVVLFVVVLLDAGQGDRDNARVLACGFVGAFHEYGVVRLYVYAEGLVSISVAYEYFVGIAKLYGEEVVAAPYPCEIAARDYSTVLVDNADNAVNCVLHLMDNALKKSV